MTKLVFIAMLLAAGAAQAVPLHPADDYDIQSAAQFAVIRQMIKTGKPIKKGESYEVPIMVNGLSCKVLVRPYSPKPMEPPIRWMADGPVCGK